MEAMRPYPIPSLVISSYKDELLVASIYCNARNYYALDESGLCTRLLDKCCLHIVLSQPDTRSEKQETAEHSGAERW